MSRPSYLLFVAMIILTSEGASLLSSDSKETSASSSNISANQRTPRSAGSLEPISSQDVEEANDKNDCSSDFVEKFFRVLSGPVGKEGEAVVAAVLKLLSEHDRVHWSDMADTDWSQPESREAFPPSGRQAGARTLSTLRQDKRMAPKFNPTGWRRKRAAGMTAQDVQQFLRAVLARYEADPDVVGLLGDVSRGSVPETAEWTNTKRSGTSRRLPRRLTPQRKPKRRPLEFNPTGW